MSVIDVRKDPATASMTITASFDAPPSRRCGAYGTIPACWSGGGGLPPGRRPSSTTTSLPAATSATT